MHLFLIIPIKKKTSMFCEINNKKELRFGVKSSNDEICWTTFGNFIELTYLLNIHKLKLDGSPTL